MSEGDAERHTIPALAGDNLSNSEAILILAVLDTVKRKRAVRILFALNADEAEFGSAFMQAARASQSPIGELVRAMHG